MNKTKFFLEKIYNETIQRVPNRLVSSYMELSDSGIDIVSFSGFNDNVNTTDDVELNNTTNLFNFDTAASTLSIVSTDANDTNAGTGVNIVSIAGLDSEYEPITELLVMNGTTPVTTVNTYIRINTCIAIISGSNLAAVGTVSLTGNSFTWATLLPGQTNAHLGRYTVPNNCTFIGEVVLFSADKAGEYAASVKTKVPTTSLFEVIKLLLYRTSSEIRGIPTASPGKTDIVMYAQKLSGSSNVRVTGFANGITFNNDIMDERLNR